MLRTAFVSVERPGPARMRTLHMQTMDEISEQSPLLCCANQMVESAFRIPLESQVLRILSRHLSSKLKSPVTPAPPIRSVYVRAMSNIGTEAIAHLMKSCIVDDAHHSCVRACVCFMALVDTCLLDPGRIDEDMGLCRCRVEAGESKVHAVSDKIP
jgi:hypothetical protein